MLSTICMSVNNVIHNCKEALMVDMFVGLYSTLLAKQPSQSWHVEPVKCDVPANHFRIFASNKFDKQLNDHIQAYNETLKLPDGWAWNPFNVDQKRIGYLYLRCEILLLAVMCIHGRYSKQLGINIWDIMRNLLEWDTRIGGDGIVLESKIKARLIKTFKINNGGSNSVQVSGGDFGMLKPKWFDSSTDKGEPYTLYGKLIGVKSFLVSLNTYLETICILMCFFCVFVNVSGRALHSKI